MAYLELGNIGNFPSFCFSLPSLHRPAIQSVFLWAVKLKYVDILSKDSYLSELQGPVFVPISSRTLGPPPPLGTAKLGKV